MALPQKITDDINAIVAAAQQFQTDNGTLPSLKAAADAADSAYAAGQAAAATDATTIQTAVSTLQADLAAFEAGTLTDPTPPA